MFLKKSLRKLTRLLIFFFPHIILFAQNSNKITKSQLPNYVLPVEVDYEKTIPYNNLSTYYLLFDEQFEIENEKRYRRFVYKILNNSGLEEEGNIEIIFDPSYSTLSFHHINIIREGKVINKLDIDNFQLLQRETNMDQNVYDGQFTALLNLTDLRKGDIVDFSYTITGQNPIHQQKFQDEFYLTFQEPLGYLHKRIIVPKNRQIHIQ